MLLCIATFCCQNITELSVQLLGMQLVSYTPKEVVSIISSLEPSPRGMVTFHLFSNRLAYPRDQAISLAPATFNLAIVLSSSPQPSLPILSPLTSP